MSVENNKCDCMILNFWPAINYGALLTCYGVYCLAEKLGKDARVINYVSFPKEVNCDDFEQSFANKFSKKYMKLTNKIKTYDDLYQLNKDCNTFIAGSDQIWRRTCANNVLGDKFNWTIFYLDFVRSNKKKISYASSIGTEEIIDSPINIEKMNFYLSQFDSISVREDRYEELLKEHFNLNSTQLIDGAFHIPKETLEKMTEEYTDKEGYIACFALPYFAHEQWYRDIVKNISNKLNLPVKEFKWDYTTPVEKWLAFIKNSKYVITDSYHCLIFALIFNVPFLQIQNAKTQNRFDSIFRLFDIPNRSVKSTNTAISYDEILAPVDWDKINTKIEQEKIKAENWLKDAFERETKEKPVYPNFLENRDMLKIQAGVDRNSLNILLNKDKIKKKYMFYKIMAVFTFGSIKEHYKKKRSEYKKKIKYISKILGD